MTNKINTAPSKTFGRNVDWEQINNSLKDTFDNESNSDRVMYLAKNTLIPSVEDVKSELTKAGYEIYDENEKLLYIRLK